MTDTRIGGEMRLVSNYDGEVAIQCQRKGCMVDRENSGALSPSNQKAWLEIPLPYDADPRLVEKVWMQHRLDHADNAR